MKIKDELKILSWYQIVGGIIGYGLTIWLILQNESLNNITVLLLLGALILYSFSIICGFVLFKSKKAGFRLSIINQFLQIFSFSLFGFAFQYHSGLQLSFGIDYSKHLLLKSDLSLTGFKLTYSRSEEELFLMFNVVPVVIISILNRLRNDLEEELQVLPSDEVMRY